MSAPRVTLRRILAALVLVAFGVVATQAQLSLSPTSFSPGQVIQSSTFSQLFANVSSRALNREGGTLTGNLLFSPDGTVDVGASAATRPRDIFVQDDVTIGDALTVGGALSGASATLSGTLGVTGATTLSAALGGTAATFSGTVTGNLFSGSGASLTSIPETAITDGSLLARVAANETISGAWDFSNGFFRLGFGVVSGANSTAPTNYSGMWLGSNLSNLTGEGATRGTQTQATLPSWGLDVGGAFGGDSGTFAADEFALYRRAAAGNWTRLLTVSNTGTLTHTGALALASTISPSALSSGNNNDYAPTGFATTYAVRVTANAGGSTLTGLAGGTAGREVVLCHVGGGTITISAEDGGSSAANRFGSGLAISGGACSRFLYDGTSSRWRWVQ